MVRGLGMMNFLCHEDIRFDLLDLIAPFSLFLLHGTVSILFGLSPVTLRNCIDTPEAIQRPVD